MENKKLYMIIINKNEEYEYIVLNGCGAYTNINNAIKKACELNKKHKVAKSHRISNNPQVFYWYDVYLEDYDDIETTNKTFIEKIGKLKELEKLIMTNKKNYKKYENEYDTICEELDNIVDNYRANYTDPQTIKYAFENDIHEEGTYGIIEIELK